VIVFYSNRTDVYENLAAEDALLDDAALTEPLVFVYRNTDAAVIGKNQVPWRECAVTKLDGMDVKLARRVSGGGTVFHDDGNINISCVFPRDHYCRNSVLDLFMNGLNRVGLDAVLVGSTNFAANGKKISGHAFCYRRDKVLHHGTLLWKANLEKLRAALVPEFPDITTRAVASVPMPVTNICDLLPGRRIEDLIQAVVFALAGKWGAVSKEEYNPFNLSGYSERLEKMKSWDWKFGATPDFEHRQGKSVVMVHRGRIQDVQGSASEFKIGQPF